MLQRRRVVFSLCGKEVESLREIQRRRDNRERQGQWERQSKDTEKDHKEL